jgi:hypothetical protein
MVIVVAGGCDDDSGIVGPEDIAELARAETKWNARPFADYSYEIRTFCFCPPEIVRWTRVSVRGGVVVDAEAVEPDPNFPITNQMWWHPVDSVFATLRRHMTQHSDYLASIVVA